MGLFNLFKRKTAKQSPYDLDLETLVERSSLNKDYDIPLYKKMLSEELVVIIEYAHPDDPETTYSVIMYEDGSVPVFTSPDRVFDNKIIQQKVDCMNITGRELFASVQGKSIILNPHSRFHKKLPAEEIEKLLTGQLFDTSDKTLQVRAKTEIQIGQPEKYPEKLVEALKELFAGMPGIKAAYLGWIYDPTSNDPPHYLFGIDTEGEMKEMMEQARPIVKEHMPFGEFADFVAVGSMKMLSDYFLKETEPFYRRGGEE